ncbi:MAG: hypothetical protein A2297_09865 [Elusimicrobia bacterium RIFOXYB2_FULL_48_7]|nr:MAG: hypothetical protein A2297_09865 [Elusimicrobia bacterium RIFOXYB2_FULL_48_7]
MANKILIVDDEINVRKMLAKLLEKKYEVDDAKDGVEAVEKLNSGSFGLVISDIQMPRMNGFVLLKEIKATYMALPVILITGYGNIEDAVKAIKLGACDYVTKPFNNDEILFIIEKCLSGVKDHLEAVSMKQCMSLFEVFQKEKETADPDKLLEMILNKSLETINASSGSIMLLKEKERVLEVVVSLGLKKKIDRFIPVGERIAGQLFKEGVPAILHNGLKQYEKFRDIKARSEIFSSMIIPLKNQGKIVGTMNFNRLNTFPYKFTELELNTMELFASYIVTILIQLVAQRKSVELDKLKTEFLGNVSHELRTPLMSIKGAIELMQNSVDKDTEKTLMGIMARNSDRLDRLVQDLLDFSKMGSGTMAYNFQDTAPGGLINELRDEFQNRFKTKNIRFLMDIPENLPLIRADAGRIKQVVSNLLTNAYKFTPENGTVELSVSDEDKKILIKVKDSGIGIPKAEQEQIFERFYQVDGSTTRTAEGTGLGLTITRLIVEAHKGKIRVESDGVPGSGTEFTVLLPKK